MGFGYGLTLAFWKVVSACAPKTQTLKNLGVVAMAHGEGSDSANQMAYGLSIVVAI